VANISIIGTKIDNKAPSLQQVMEAARKYFDVVLEPHGLTERQILEQDLPGLKMSLTATDDLIIRNQSYPSVKIKIAASGVL
jgi:hypothetical protein